MLENLPLNALQSIAQHLDIKDAINLSETSRQMNRVVNDLSVWDSYLRRDFGIQDLPSGTVEEAKQRYKELTDQAIKKLETLAPELLNFLRPEYNRDYMRAAAEYPAQSAQALQDWVLLPVAAKKAAAPAAFLQMQSLISFLAITAPLDESGCTPFYWASFFGNLEVVKAFLAHPKFDVNLADEEGRTNLFWAAVNGSQEIVQALYAHPNIDVNKADKDGLTPLLAAIQCERFKMLPVLLTHPSIDVHKRSNDGDSPADIAVRYPGGELEKPITAHLTEQARRKQGAATVALLIRSHFAQARINSTIVSDPGNTHSEARTTTSPI